VSRHPYRTSTPAPPSPPAAPRSDFEERFLKVVLFVVGMLGVIAGIAIPNCTVELSLGLLLLLILARWTVSDALRMRGLRRGRNLGRTD
jgi:hypothetical protein